MDLPLWARVGVGVGCAATFAYAATPIAIGAAKRLSFYDVPAGYKGHRRPTPYLGGAAVVAAFALALLVGAGDPGRTLPLLGGVLALLVVGTVDDRRSLSPQLRVAVELVVGATLGAAGVGWHLGAGAGVDAAVMAVWVVGVVNAFNLFDNMDGAASTMAIVVAGGASILGVITGDGWVAAGAAALCGACVGFLPHNLASPAKVFLGDGGSMPLGLAAAAFVAKAAGSAEPSSLSLLVGLLLVGVPALDTCLVIVSRNRRQIPILSGGQDHLTHRTRQRMGTARRVVLVLGSLQAVVSALVIVATRESSSLLVYIVLAFIVCAATAIVALDDTIGGEAVRERLTLRSGDPPRPSAAWVRTLPVALLGALGIGAGISPLFSAYYSSGVWLSVGLVLTIAAAAVTIARAPNLTRPVSLALAGLAGLGLWSLVSGTWAQAVEPTISSANLWLAYAALMLFVVVLIRERRHATALLTAVGIGIAIVAVSVLVRMLGSAPGDMFLLGRLNSPLGYVNGEGCVFAMGCWLALALAERRRPLFAGVGAAGTVAFACLVLLSQSRGTAIAAFVSIVVALVVIPGARRRLLALGVASAGVAAVAAPVVHAYSRANGAAAPASVIHTAALAIFAASLGAGVIWAIVVGCEQAIRNRGTRATAVLERCATAAAIVVVMVPVGAVIVRASSIEHTISTQWHAFVHLSDNASSARSDGQSRLLSGGGNRYDYWRIAWHVFRSNPIAGVGAGNYTQSYFRERHTQEAIQNPHSLELQVLSELGVIGGVFLALLLAGVAVGAWRLRALARHSTAARTLMVAATGVTVVWLVDTSGDWMHLLPGVMAIALAAIAVLCRVGGLEGDGAGEVTGAALPRTRSRLPSLATAATVAIVLAIGGASLLRAKLAQVYLSSARSELAHHPAAAITDAGRALRLDSANLDAYYVKAAGLARFDRAAAARATLLAAAHQDPGNFVTWVLLGDLDVRAGDLPGAKVFYRRAHALDPNDPSVAALAAHPAAALNRPDGT